MHVSYLPRAVAAGARVRAGVEARRIIFDGERAAGVDCRAGVADRSRLGRPFRVRARRAVVLAGGAFGTPELLLRSSFVSPSGELGRNLRMHPATWVGGRFDEQVRGWDGVMQSYAIDEWEDRGVLLEATFTPLAFGGAWLPGTGFEHQERLLAYGEVASTGIHLSDRSSGRVAIGADGSLRISYRLQRQDAERIAFGIARAAEVLYAAGASEVYPQVSGLVTLPRGRIADFEASPPPARALRLEAFHPMGTARMDADPARGVTAPDGAVHGAESLYVADASLLPSSIGVNPMITIAAIAARVGRGLAERAGLGRLAPEPGGDRRGRRGEDGEDQSGDRSDPQVDALRSRRVGDPRDDQQQREREADRGRQPERPGRAGRPRRQPHRDGQSRDHDPGHQRRDQEQVGAVVDPPHRHLDLDRSAADPDRVRDPVPSESGGEQDADPADRGHRGGQRDAAIGGGCPGAAVRRHRSRAQSPGTLVLGRRPLRRRSGLRRRRLRGRRRRGRTATPAVAVLQAVGLGSERGPLLLHRYPTAVGDPARGEQAEEDPELSAGASTGSITR